MKKAFYRGIPCYFNPDFGIIEGRNWITDRLLSVMIWIDINVFEVDEFPILIEEDND